MFNPQDRVNRIEDRHILGATVLSIQPSSIPEEPDILELAYDEGGTGWWPSECLAPETQEV